MAELKPLELDVDRLNTRARMAEVFGSNLLPGLASLVLPDPQATGVGKYVPGVIPMAVGGLGRTLDISKKPLDYVFDQIGMGTPKIPIPDIIPQSEQSYQRSVDRALELIPHEVPQNQDEAIAQNAGLAAGSMLTPVPGAVISRLPTAAKVVGGALLPGAVGTLPLAGFAAGASGAADAVLGTHTTDLASPMNFPTPPIPPTQAVVGQLAPGNIDLNNRPVVKNGDGYSTVRSMSVNFGDGEVLIPTVSDDGRLLTDDQAVELYRRTGKHLGVFDTPENATTFANNLHNQQAAQYGPKSVDIDPNALEPLESFGDSTTKVPQFGRESNWTNGDLLTGVASAVALLGAWKYRSRLTETLFQGAREARYARMADEFNDNLTSRWRGDVAAVTPTGEPPLQAPLPGKAGGPVGGVLKAAENYVLNKDAQLNAFTDAAAQSPNIARELRAATGRVDNTMTWDATIREFMRTGVDPYTGMTMPSFTNWSKGVARLSSDEQELLNQALYFRDERNNRARNFRSLTAAGNAPNDVNVRHNVWSIDGQTLDATIAKAEQNPKIKALLDQHDTIMKRNLDIAEARGFITTEAKQKILRDHPNYLATVDENAKIMHSFGERDISGVAQEVIPGYAWDASKQHFEALHRAMELNDWRRAVVYAGLDYQRRNPQAARLFVKVDAPSSMQGVDNSTTPTIAVRTNSGLEYYNVNNASLLQTLNGAANAIRTGFDGMGYLRQMYQRGTTGTMALVNGRWFAPTNAFRTAMQMGINRPAGMYGGALDKASSLLTGGRLPLRIPDLTNLIGAPVSAGINLANDTIYGVAGLLDSTALNPMNRMLRAILGDSAVDALSQRMIDRYLRSSTHEERALGIGGQGSYTTAEVKNNQLGASRNIYNPVNRMVPQLYMPGGRFGAAGIHLANMVNYIHNLVSDSAHSYLYKLNRNNAAMGSKNVIADEVRNISGDPGRIGGGRVARIIDQVVPFHNVTKQGTARLGRVLNESPIAGTFSYANAALTAALGSIMSAVVIGGPDAVKHLAEQLTTQQRGANVVIYTGKGNPTENNVQFSLPQELRAIYPVVLDMASSILGAWDAHKDEESYDRIVGTLKDFWSNHISDSTITSMKHGAAEMVDPFLNVAPPIVQAPLAAAGQAFAPQADAIADAVQDGKSVAGSMFIPLGTERRAPNAQVSDGLGGGRDMGAIENALSAVLGIAGGAYSLATGAMRDYNYTKDPMYAFTNLGAEWWQRAMDQNAYANTTVWQNNTKLSTRNPIAERVGRTMEIIRPTLTMAGDLKNEGMSGAKGVPVANFSGQTQVPTDPVMAQMYGSVAKFGNFIEGKLMPQITATKKQIDSLRSSPFAPDVKRQLHNDWARSLEARYELISRYIGDLNVELSQIAGRPVRIENGIDWKAGVEQFGDPE